MNGDRLLAEAARMWAAAESLDALHGGDRAWQWTGRQVAKLLRDGRADDSAEVARIADALESRLARDRGKVGT